jgi:hypothetical protein
MNSFVDTLVTSKEGRVFQCHFFTQNISPKDFTLHELYYLIKDGKVYELGFGEPSVTGDDPCRVILSGTDVGPYDSKKKYALKFYDFNLQEFKKFKRPRRCKAT